MKIDLSSKKFLLICNIITLVCGIVTLVLFLIGGVGIKIPTFWLVLILVVDAIIQILKLLKK